MEAAESEATELTANNASPQACDIEESNHIYDNNDEETKKKNESIAVDLNAVIPQLSSSPLMDNDDTSHNHSITYGDMQTAIRVLNAVTALHPKKRKKVKNKKLNSTTTEQDENLDHGDAEPEEDDGLTAYKHANLRPLRKALADCLELHKLTMFQGKEEVQHYEDLIQKRSLKRQKIAERDLHRKYIETTELRRGRVERLKQLQEEAKDEETARLMAETMIPDGHVETMETGNKAQRLLTDDQDALTEANQLVNENAKELPKFRSCYVCKVRFRQLHHFYDQLCPSCAALNWQKRHQSASMHGRVAVVTGARVKIGRQVCLKLLRSGCTVIATTRFPNAAVAAYRTEDDFDQWNHQLQIYGLDLRDVTGLEAFTRFLKMKFSSSGIDVIINNACQTVRRPVGYYVPLVEQEQEIWKNSDAVHQSILEGCTQFEKIRRRLQLDHNNSAHQSQPLLPGHSERERPLIAATTQIEEVYSDNLATKHLEHAVVATTSSGKNSNPEDEITTPFETRGLSHSAAMSQMIILPEDAGINDSILPPGVTDINGHQLDLRSTNSWRLKLEEVSTPEVMECIFINAIAPFVLNSRLKPLMCIPNETSCRPDRYIINVSAMEGKFYRYKMPNHPHTNMAKAALNMMTRTSAEDLAKNHRIFMNAVDTGWINDENPLERAKKTAETNKFQTPIDEIDAAARILDPIFVGVNGGPDAEKEYGKFLKDYRETEW